MREFAETEMVREKCHICGCKNKLVIPLSNKNTIGIAIRCCNCGRTINYINPERVPYVMDFIHGNIYAKSPTCIQESYCPHTKCELYGTCGNNDKFKPPCDIEGSSIPCYVICNHPCEYYYLNMKDPSHCVNDFPNSQELTVNELREPKFK